MQKVKSSTSVKVIQKYQDDIKVINERKKALDELKKKAERNIDNLKQYGLVQMSRLDMKKVASPTLTVSIRNSKVMNIKDESKLPKNTSPKKLRRKLIKQHSRNTTMVYQLKNRSY